MIGCSARVTRKAAEVAQWVRAQYVGWEKIRTMLSRGRAGRGDDEWERQRNVVRFTVWTVQWALEAEGERTNVEGKEGLVVLGRESAPDAVAVGS